MLYFIIPLRDASTTSDWPGVCRLLDRTLASACGQLQDAYRVVIVGHTLPEDYSLPDRCEFISVRFDPPLLTAADDFQRKMWVMHTDKGRKILHGLAKAREDAGSYVMFLDADDLVSNRLAGFVAEHEGANGWYFEHGYRLNVHPKPQLFWRKRFYHECGSSHMIRSDLAPFPDQLDDAADFSDYFVRRYVVHAYVKDDLEKRGTPLSPLPFYGSIYTFNGCNIFATEGRRSESCMYKIMQRLIKGCRMTSALKSEFGLA